MEAFSDGVIAIIITIMVLELKVPHGENFQALAPLIPVFLSYVLSFAYLGIYWNNHHHMLHVCEKVTGPILWANLHLLFWLSLFPFATAWMGAASGAPLPIALYGAVLFMAGAAYRLLEVALVAHHGHDSAIARALGRSRKEFLSVASYAAAIALAFVAPRISQGIYVAVALLWFVPDPRFERVER